MITLPTRADGGIDWDKLWPPETVRPEALRLSFIQVGKEAAAHERERCAKWHDEQANDCAMSIDAEMLHRESAAAIRKMED